MSAASSSPLFTEPPKERSFPTTAVAIAAVAVLVLVVVLVLLGRRDGKAQPLNAAYAPNLSISNLQISQSDTVPGGKVTYVEGHVQNNGTLTVTAATVRVVFSNNVSMPPETDTVPLRLIRIREPEIDTQAVSSAPIAPGQGADFYLIFENVAANWNEQTPAVSVVGAETK